MTITIDIERDKLFSEAGIKLMEKYYQKDGKEGVQKAIARAANCFSFGDQELAQRIYDAASRHWFFYSSPILSNAVEGVWRGNYWDKKDISLWDGPKPKAMPIACFLAYAADTIEGQVNTAAELSYLSVMGGGTAVHSAIRAVSEKAPGPIPYFKTIDALMGYYRQGKTRRGSAALYLDVDHPDIIEFINMRKPSGGDPARKIDNRAGVHCGINLSQEFMNAVNADTDWNLVDPHSGEVRETLKARKLWEAILETREFTGEPYLYRKDVAQIALPESQKALGLQTNGSNLCSEITLATNDERTAVCCLSSLNLEKYDEWKDTTLVADLVRFLDNVIEWFILFAPDVLKRAKFSAERERAIGIGAMGWHNFLMKNMIPFESGGFNSAAQWNNIIFKSIHQQAVEESLRLGSERSEPEDMRGTGRRNSHLFAIAPNANSSVLCNTSPSIEPILSNAYAQKSRAGVSLVKNKYLDQWLEKYLDQRYDDFMAMGERYMTWEFDHEADFWKDVVAHNGSIQHMEWIPEEVRKVFKTAWEIDQMWVVEHAIMRQPYICQAQSLNVFFLPGTERKYINRVHMYAMSSGTLKSMYYFRTGSEAAADLVRQVERKAIADAKQTEEECLSCHG